MMRWFIWMVVAAMLAGPARALTAFPARELSMDRMYGTRPGDPSVYCVLGDSAASGRDTRSLWFEDPLVGQWLASHPNAVAQPISSLTRTIPSSGPGLLTVYVWIEDRGESLNVELVRRGHFGADAMTSRPHRWISEGDYAAKMQRVALAEREAREDKRGLWSEAGMPGRSPPHDGYLIRQYRDHPAWFARVRALLREEPRLAQVNRQPSTWALAERAGVRKGALDEYVGLLERLDVNEVRVTVEGLGRLCLIAADIPAGVFGAGAIKGYVWLPSDPRPLVLDLGNWPAGTSHETPAYRAVADGWYLFEVQPAARPGDEPPPHTVLGWAAHWMSYPMDAHR
jgi:hypothetical protein